MGGIGTASSRSSSVTERWGVPHKWCWSYHLCPSSLPDGETGENPRYHLGTGLEVDPKAEMELGGGGGHVGGNAKYGFKASEALC
jgi:hypothetical protein